MPRFASFMSTAESAGGPATGFGGSPTQQVLEGIRMIGQEETNWCWSAVTQTILNFRRNVTLAQEDIASEHAERHGKTYDCKSSQRRVSRGGICADESCRGCCNDAHILRIVLHEQDCFHSPISEERAPTFVEIQGEISRGRPVACRIQWDQGGGHFVIVSGWMVGADAEPRVQVLDPASNEGGRAIVQTTMPYADFAERYEQSGVTGFVNYSYRVR